MSDVRKAWAAIERCFERHPGAQLKLRPPATEKSIAAAEHTLGIRFPDDYRESLLVHDGQDDEPNVFLFPVAQRLGSLESLVTCWKDDRKYFDETDPEKRFEWLDDSERVRQVHLHPKQIPIAGSTYWDYGRLLIDYVPGPAGTAGQIIARDDIDLRFIAPSFGVLLSKIATGLEDGTTVVTEHDGQFDLAPKKTQTKAKKKAKKKSRR